MRHIKCFEKFLAESLDVRDFKASEKFDCTVDGKTTRYTVEYVQHRPGMNTVPYVSLHDESGKRHQISIDYLNRHCEIKKII